MLPPRPKGQGLRKPKKDDASSDGWQLDGDENHYCPQHWHLICSKCGKTAMGNHDELIENGWDCATDEWLCPECH